MHKEPLTLPVSTGRRRTLLSLLTLVVLSACSRVSSSTKPQSDSPSRVVDAFFVKTSKALIGREDLEEQVAERHAAALEKFFPGARHDWQRLAPLLEGAASPSAALTICDDAGMKSLALSIVAAWYTGTVGTGVHAITVAYRDALMQQPTADALAPPTYALGGPAWWVAGPPDVGVSRPTRSAPEPKTVGNPEPKQP